MDTEVACLHPDLITIRRTMLQNYIVQMYAAPPSAKRQRMSDGQARQLSPPSDASSVSVYEPCNETTPQSRKRSAAVMQQAAGSNLLRPSLPAAPASLLPPLWDGLRHCLVPLNIQYCSTLALAGFMWQGLRDSVLYGGRTLYFTPVHRLSMSDTVLLGCLVVAIKMEECRKGAPSNARIALACCTSASAVSRLEILVLEACDWRPLAGWASAQRRWALQSGASNP